MAKEQGCLGTSRRQFLWDVGITSVVALSGVGIADLTTAANLAPNRARRLDIDFKPDFRAAGGVLLIAPHATYLTYRALWGEEIVDSVEAGTAVIELKGCVATRFRYPGGEPEAGDACLADTLEICNAYEVEDSSWLQCVRQALPQSLRQSQQPLNTRHFVFTFFPTSFECLADSLSVDVWFEPFSEIAASLYAPI
jgi:hypothetical protein